MELASAEVKYKQTVRLPHKVPERKYLGIERKSAIKDLAKGWPTHSLSWQL